MPIPWISSYDYVRNALIPYGDDQISDAEMAPGIQKGQGWVRSFVSPVITNKADGLATLSDDAPLKLCAAMFAAYFVLRARFIGRGPNKSEYLSDMRDDADKLLEEIKLSPSKALGGGVTLTSTEAGTFGITSSKEGRHTSFSPVDETHNSIDPETIEDDLDARANDD